MSELRRISKGDIVLAILSLMGMEPRNREELEELKRQLQDFMEEPIKEKEPVYRDTQRTGRPYPL